MNSKSPIMHALRWIAVLPAAVAGYFVGNLIAGVFSIFSGMESWEVDLPKMIASALCFVHFGSYIAPGRRREVAIILALLNIALSGFGIYATWTLHQHGWYPWWLSACYLAAATAGFLCARYTQESLASINGREPLQAPSSEGCAGHRE